MLIDTHVHLNSDKFHTDLPAVIDRARQVGVDTMIVVGFDKPTNKRAIELAESYPFLYATVGYHPTEAPNVTESDFDLLREQLSHDRVVGVGECGLDFYWDTKHIDQQIAVFERQIALSKELDKPLVVHMRDASEATYNVLAEHAPLRGIMHCYSGSAEMAPMFLELGMHISLGGPVTFLNGHKPKAVARVVPLDRLLVETDAPYLSPHPFRGKRNEPARVRLVAEAIAHVKDLPYQTIASETTKNAKDLFRI
jgi:TatD DNase family protein